MAGTRLWVVLSVFLPFLLLLTGSVFIGLLKDRLLVARVLSFVFKRPFQEETILEHSFPPLTAVVFRTPTEWETQDNKRSFPFQHWDDSWNVKTLAASPSNKQWQHVCERHYHTSTTSQSPLPPADTAAADVWVCPPSSNKSNQQAKVVVLKGGPTLLYPDKNEAWPLPVAAEDGGLVVPQYHRYYSRDTIWNVTLVFDNNIYKQQRGGGDDEMWKEALHHLQQTIQPPLCVKELQWKVAVWNATTDDAASLFASDNNKNNMVTTILSFVAAPTINNNNETTTTKTTVRSHGHRQWVTVPPTADYTELSHLLTRHVLVRHCWNLPNRVEVVLDDYGEFSSVFDKLYLRRMLRTRYTAVAQRLVRQANVLHHLPRRVMVEPHVRRLYQQAWEAVTGVQQQQRGQPHSYKNATLWLDRAHDVLYQLETDSALSPPVDLPPEQYLAVFAPLLLPLLLPLILSLVREGKRWYRTQTLPSKSVETSVPGAKGTVKQD